MKKFLALPYVISLLAILFFSTLVRLFNLGFPAEYVFDETYHVPAVRLIAEGDQRAFEWWHRPIYSSDNHDWLHPPLAKYIQASFYNLGHGTIVSWRMGSVVFGLLGIILVYVLAILLTNSPLVGLLSALLLSLDGLWLVQSRIAMNDVFVSVFILLVSISYLLFLKSRQPFLLILTGSLLGVSLATKWTALFFILGLIFFEIINIFKVKNFKLLPLVIFSLLVLPFFVYIFSYAPVLLSGKSLSFLVDLHKNIFYYQFNRDNLHFYQSLPWQWILNLRSVWYWTNGQTQNIYLLNNPLLVIFYLFSLFFVVTEIIKNKKSLSLTYLLFFYILSWSGWLISPRILFYYHYLPAIPFLAVMTAIVIKNLYFNNKFQGMFLFLFNISLLVAFFWLYYPLWVGLPVSQDLYQALYLLLPSWK